MIALSITAARLLLCTDVTSSLEVSKKHLKT